MPLQLHFFLRKNHTGSLLFPADFLHRILSRCVGFSLACGNRYTVAMLDEATFRRESERALESLKQALIAAEDASGSFEFEDNSGAMNILFEDGSSKFVVTPNTPVRQIWISAQTTSFKLDWDEAAGAFVLPKTGEALMPLVQRLLREHLGDASITLGGPV